MVPYKITELVFGREPSPKAPSNQNKNKNNKDDSELKKNKSPVKERSDAFTFTND